jgi:hypothetical protein
VKRYREFIGGSVFFLFAATYFVMAFQIPTFNDGFISSDFMPKVYGTILMLLSVIQIIPIRPSLPTAEDSPAYVLMQNELEKAGLLEH